MRRPVTLAAALMALAVAGAQAQNWPNETGVQRDVFRGDISRLEGFGTNPNLRTFGEENRETVGGWIGAVRGWFDRQAEKIGQNDSDSSRFFDRQRSLEREWDARRR
ncbi:MAG: hypothetical protein K2X11_22700 [Acetobacteraceae bacterium]|nr:hypothetical protein [Acetobacteraceae bacterium]